LKRKCALSCRPSVSKGKGERGKPWWSRCG
jgi:hypothetical protein